MTENEALKIFENEVIILDCWIENDKDIIANCDTEDDEFDDVKELAELSLKDYSERKELFETAISALKEIQQYREIGTVEECRKAVEKQKLKKPVKDKYNHNCCPNCGWIVSGEGGYGEEFCPHCENCGQAIRWENLGEMEDERD